jgi:hypothetical protein
MTTRVYQAAVLAMEIYMRDKAEAVELVRDNYDTLGPFLLELDDIAGDARDPAVHEAPWLKETWVRKAVSFSR